MSEKYIVTTRMWDSEKGCYVEETLGETLFTEDELSPGFLDGLCSELQSDMDQLRVYRLKPVEVFTYHVEHLIQRTVY